MRFDEKVHNQFSKSPILSHRVTPSPIIAQATTLCDTSGGRDQRKNDRKIAKAEK